MPASSPGSRSSSVDREAVPLGPAHVHAHQHLGPVLRLGAAGAGMDREERVAPVVGTLQHRLELEARRMPSSSRADLALQLRFHRRVGLRAAAAPRVPRASDARVFSSSNGVTQPLRILISCTTVRARSGLVQKPGSPCWASSVLRRSRLLARSKKVSEFEETRLQVGQAVGQVGHCDPSVKVKRKLNSGGTQERRTTESERGAASPRRAPRSRPHVLTS